MPTATIQVTTDELIAAGLTCKCWEGRRALPVRFTRSLLNLLEMTTDPETLVATFRCADCKEVVLLRTSTLQMAAASM